MVPSLEGKLGHVFDTAFQELQQQPMGLHCSHKFGLHEFGPKHLQSPSWLVIHGTRHRQ